MKTFSLRSTLPLVLLLLVAAGCQPVSLPGSPPEEPVSSWTPYRVTDFGAKGDGVTDDTDAIQRCITTAEQTQTPYNKSETTYPEVLFPPGHYVLSRTLIVAATEKTRNLAIRGLGTATLIQKDPGQDILYFHPGYRQALENLGLSGVRIQSKFFSRSMNRAQLILRNCRFADSGSYAVDDSLKGPHHSRIVDPYTIEWKDGLPRGTQVNVDAEPDIFYTSSVLHIDRCEFIRCRNVARLFADWGMITRCKIVTSPDMKGAAIYSRGVLKVTDTQVQANTRPGRQQRFVDNINAGVMLDRVTIDSDGAGLCAIYNRRPYDNGGTYNTYTVIDASRIRAAGSEENCWVYCEEVPNLIRVTDSTELSGKEIPAVGFRQPVTPGDLRGVSFPELVQRLPELAQIFGYEAAMPRIFDIDDVKRPLNFSFSIHGNKSLTETLPDALQPFVKKSLPDRIRDGFSPLANRTEVEAPEPARRLNVMDFGAVGDGKQDDTEAIRRAVAAVAVGGKTPSELIFPSGLYLLSQPIDLPERLTIRGVGLAVFKTETPDIPLFKGQNVRRTAFVNIGFYQAARAVELTTRATEEAEILFDRCAFSKIADTVIQCFAGNGGTGEKNRTRLRITDSVFGGAGHALVTNADDSLFDFN